MHYLPCYFYLVNIDKKLHRNSVFLAAACNVNGCALKWMLNLSGSSRALENMLTMLQPESLVENYNYRSRARRMTTVRRKTVSDNRIMKHKK